MLSALLFSAWAMAAIPEGLGDWEIHSTSSVLVSCTSAEGAPWCRSEAVIPADSDDLAALLQDFPNYPRIFKRVTSARVLAPGVVHITLSMPFPFSDRDYVARFEEREVSQGRVFDFTSVTHPGARPVKGSVRLPEAGGQWRLEPQEGGGTKVTYTWNGKLGGDFPSWALPQAWSTQGAEVMAWLAEASASPQ